MPPHFIGTSDETPEPQTTSRTGAVAHIPIHTHQGAQARRAYPLARCLPHAVPAKAPGGTAQAPSAPMAPLGADFTTLSPLPLQIDGEVMDLPVGAVVRGSCAPTAAQPPQLAPSRTHADHGPRPPPRQRSQGVAVLPRVRGLLRGCWLVLAAPQEVVPCCLVERSRGSDSACDRRGRTRV